MKNLRLTLVVIGASTSLLALLYVCESVNLQDQVDTGEEPAHVTQETIAARGSQGAGGVRVSVRQATLKGIALWPGNVPAVGAKIGLEGDPGEVAIVQAKGQFELPVLSRLVVKREVFLTVRTPCWRRSRRVRAEVLRNIEGASTVADLGVVVLPDEVDCEVRVQLAEAFVARLRSNCPAWSADLAVKEPRVGGNPLIPVLEVARTTGPIAHSVCTLHATIPFRPEVEVHVWLKPDSGESGLGPIYVSRETVPGSTRFVPSRLASNSWHLDLSTMGCLELQAVDQNGAVVPEASLHASQTVLGDHSLQIKTLGFGHDLIIGKIGSRFRIRGYFSGLELGPEDLELVVDNGRHKIQLDMSSRMQLMVTKNKRPLARYHVGTPRCFNEKCSEYLPKRNGGRSWLYFAVGGEGGWIALGWKGKNGYVEREFLVPDRQGAKMEIDLDSIAEPIMGEIVISAPKGRKLRIDIRKVYEGSKRKLPMSMYHKLLVPFPGSTQLIRGLPAGRYELRVDSLRLARFPNLGAGDADTGRRHLFKIAFECRGGSKVIDVGKLLRDRGL